MIGIILIAFMYVMFAIAGFWLLVGICKVVWDIRSDKRADAERRAKAQHRFNYVTGQIMRGVV